MYIRYWNPAYVGHFLVKDVRYFGIEDAGEDEDGVNLYAICDLTIDSLSRQCNDAICSLATHILGGDEKILRGAMYRDGIRCVNHDDEWKEDLAFFNSPQAAIKVLNEICAALDAGKQYFDLTVYDESGNLES